MYLIKIECPRLLQSKELKTRNDSYIIKCYLLVIIFSNIDVDNIKSAYPKKKSSIGIVKILNPN